MASSELTSLPRFCDIVWPQLYILVMLSGCYYQKGSDKWLIPLCYFKTNQNYKGEKYAHPKSDFVVRLVVIAPPPFKLKYSARNRVKRKWWYNKVTQLVSSIFYHTSQYILWEKRRQTGTSAMNFYRWTCSWFLSPLSSPVEETTESFKIMLR